jgi:hypothetical protein
MTSENEKDNEQDGRFAEKKKWLQQAAFTIVSSCLCYYYSYKSIIAYLETIVILKVGVEACHGMMRLLRVVGTTGVEV